MNKINSNEKNETLDGAELQELPDYLFNSFILTRESSRKSENVTNNSIIQSDEKDVFFETDTSMQNISPYVNSKLLIRAVLMGDYNFLEKLSNDNQFLNICGTFIYRSVSIKRNAIHYAILNEDLKSIKLLLQIEKNLASNHNNQHCLLNHMDLYHSELLMDNIDRIDFEDNFTLNKSYIQFAFKHNVKCDFIDNFSIFFKNRIEDFLDNFVTVIKTGNYELAVSLGKKYQHYYEKNKLPVLFKILTENFSLEQHRSLLNESCFEKQFKLYPIHIAAINPDPFLFQNLINNSFDQIYIADCNEWMPIHFASVCKSKYFFDYILVFDFITFFSFFQYSTFIKYWCFNSPYRIKRQYTITFSYKVQSNTKCRINYST